jgi:hypothetical protein
MRRRAALLAGWTVGFVALAWPAASATFLGSDPIGNISPESQVSGGLADRYPLSAYALDYHVYVGLTDPGGVAPMIAHWAAAQLWSMTSFIVKVVIDLFTWTFSLDLLGGDPTTGSGGAAPRGGDRERLRERDRRGMDGRRDPGRRHLGNLEGACAAPLHRDRRRAGRLGAVRADRALLRVPA